MSTFTADEQRVILMALAVMLAVSAVRLFPARGLPPPAAPESRAGLPDAARADTDPARPDPNEAPLEALLRVPGMSAAMASAILKHRSNHILVSAADLAAIPGVREADARAVTGFMTFPGAKPAPRAADGSRLDLNRATPAQLEQLPGVGADTARAILERRKQRPFSDLEELLALPGIGPGKLEELAKVLVVGPAEPGKGR